MPTIIDGVEVEFGPLDTDWRKTGITVKVHSRKRAGLRARVQLDPATQANAQAVAQFVGVAAANGAIYLGEKYGDNFTPERCAKLAIQALYDEARLQAECAKGVPIKLARVQAHEGKLGAAERELLDRMVWRSGRGLTTPSEVAQINDWIAAIHAGTLGAESASAGLRLQ